MATKVIPVSWDQYNLQEGLQNFVVVIEMFFFAIAHYFAFSHRPYIDPAAAEVPCISTCFRMLDVRDVADDVREHFVDPIPRPFFRVGGRREEESAEDSPLLKRRQGEGLESEGNGINDSDGPHTSDGIPDLSFDVLSYKELDSKRKYGQRARMIADAGKKLDDEALVNETTDRNT